MPHNLIFIAILGALLYVVAPKYFGWAFIVMAAWIGYSVIGVVWKTTKELREFPDAVDETDDDEGVAETGDEPGQEEDEDKDKGKVE